MVEYNIIIDFIIDTAMSYTAKKMKFSNFPLRLLQILNGKFHFLCSVSSC